MTLITRSLPIIAGCALALIALGGCQHRPTSDLTPKYEDRDARHTERPGPHSTTVGRHGTAGEAGGGIDAQSGPGEPNMDEDPSDRPAAGAR